ncbi:MAG: adenine-specific DNA-methyltransferase, partial [Acidimicrobiaceae bacterium]|nr:adenine-specific DNA-methyltransferase [Acidimicrobiaceae bacterium]
MIKYIGSKRRLVPALRAIGETVAARDVLDLFTGTTRVAQAFRAAGARVTAVDRARYAEVFARTYVGHTATTAADAAIAAAIDHLNAVPPAAGYVTEVFCRQARYFHPDNGARIDAIRAAIARDYAEQWLEPILLTALLEAADRVDSTTGVQMAYLKSWAPRAHNALRLIVPVIPDGPAGRAIRGDAAGAAASAGRFDLAYLDPPYNQHRYDSNYHVWETLVAGDEPEHYGIACKRNDLREPGTRSLFNSRRSMPGALRECLDSVDARVVVISYNDESWLALDELMAMARARGPVVAYAFDSKRYVGAQIGIHNPAGDKVGVVGRLRNREYIVVAGDLAGEQWVRLDAAMADGHAEIVRVDRPES